MTGEKPRARVPRWMKALLAVSLALNLAVAGALGGIALRRAADPPVLAQWRMGPEAGVSLRHALAALPEDARQAMRAEWRAQMRADRDTAATGPGTAEVLALLRAETLDTDALRAAFDAPQARLQAASEAGAGLLVAQLAEMDVDARRAYADRLAERLERRLRGRPGTAR